VDGRALSPRRASRVGPRRGHESGTFAQNLSNKLGADVIAPSRALWVLDEDRLVIGWIYPTFDIRGEWRRFRPDPSWRGVHEP